MSESVEQFDVHWNGPYIPEALGSAHEDSVLYMICGTHGLYGRNVLLYLGKTERLIRGRLKEHSWIHLEPDPVTIYTACIGKFFDWKTNGPDALYPPLDRATFEAVESLLILAHRPAFNSRSTGSLSGNRQLRVFNTGRRSGLFPEVSTTYWNAPGEV